MHEIDRCALAAVDEAERLHAFGAFIAALRVRWAEYLRRELGTRHGAWEVTRDIALGKAQDRIRELEAENAGLVEQKDGAYSERNQLVAALSKLLPAWLERHPDDDVDWEDDWREDGRTPTQDLDALRAQLAAAREDGAQLVDIVFDGPPGEPGPPGPTFPRFIEAEDAAGHSIRVGDWVQRDDNYWVLRITAIPKSKVAAARQSQDKD